MDSDVALSKYGPICPDAGHAGELRQALHRLKVLYPEPEQLKKVTLRVKGQHYRLETEGDLAPRCDAVDWE